MPSGLASHFWVSGDVDEREGMVPEFIAVFAAVSRAVSRDVSVDVFSDFRDACESVLISGVRA